MARANKGERDQMMVYPPRALGDAIRDNVEALNEAGIVKIPTGEYIASVLAERLGHPYWSAPEVRAFGDEGLSGILREADLPDPEPANDSWDDRDTFVTKPVKALGQIVRDAAKRRGMSLTAFITNELAAFHGFDLDNRLVLGKALADNVVGEHDLDRKREVLRLMA